MIAINNSEDSKWAGVTIVPSIKYLPILLNIQITT